MRYALRSLTKAPAFTIVALLALALGIGANTAIFSVIDSLLLKPLPFEHPKSLVYIQENRRGRQPISVSYPNFRDWQAQNRSFVLMAARQGETYTLLGIQEPEQIEGSNVTAELFPLLGIKPILGRTFLPTEDRPGAERVVVLTYGFWQRRFHGSGDVLGRQLNLDGESFTVIGVMPKGFRYPYTDTEGQIFTSLGRLGDQLAARGARSGLYALARLRPGITLAAARADLDSIARRLEIQYPAANGGIRVEADLLEERMVRGIRPALLVLLAAVAFVLLIACANVANLLIARAVSRSREMAIRSALGAGRGHLIRQLLSEGIALSLGGGVLGLLIAYAGVRGLRAITPADTLRASDIAMSSEALLFTLAISILAGLVFGLIPLFSGTRRDVFEAIKSGGPAPAGSSRQRARIALIVAEVALSTVLLAGAGLLLGSFNRLIHASPGLQPGNVTALRLTLPQSAYATPASRVAFGERLVERVESMPGVQSAGLVHPLPLSGFGNQIGVAPIDKVISGPQDVTTVDYMRATPDYFRTLGIPLRDGRSFTARDREGSPAVCIIDETLARLFFPDGHAIGKRLRPNPLHGGGMPPLEIVGVVGHVKSYGVDQPSRVELYVPHAQSPSSAMTLMVKTAGSPAAVIPAIREELHRIDPNQPLAFVVSMQQVVDETNAQKRLSTFVLAIFAAAALLLAAVGLYGVVSYSVAQRTREFGVRMAVGASRWDVLRLVIRQGAWMAGGGVAIGLVGAAILTRYLTSQLFGISPLDPATFGIVTVVLIAVSIAASLVPARRATRVDPLAALRAD